MFRSALHYFYKHLIESKSTNDDASRREFMVNVVLVGSIGLVGILIATTVLNIISKSSDTSTPSLVLTLCSIELFLIVLLIISRKKYYTIASYGIVGIYLAGALYEIIHWGTELPEATLPLTLVIIMSSILINVRAGFIITGFITCVIISLQYLELQGSIIPDTTWKIEKTTLLDGIEQSAIYIIIMLISWLYNHQIDKSLKRAQESEEALRRERDHLEETLLVRSQELRRIQAERIAHSYRFIELGKMASGVFHDLMVPLTSVTLSVEELRLKNHAVEEAVIASKKIKNFIKAIRRHISNEDYNETFYPHTVIEEALTLFDYQIRQHNIQLIQSINTVSQRIGNSLHFHQIIINLVSNALHALHDVHNPTLTIHLWEENNDLKLLLKDNGCGMSTTTLHHIFEPFFTTKNSEGTGLGLSIVKNIIEQNFKGNIVVTSELNKGTTFIVTIPHHDDYTNKRD